MSAYALLKPSPTRGTKSAKVFVVNQPPRASSVSAKSIRTATNIQLRLVKSETESPKSQWQKYIEEDPQGLLNVLQRMVSAHPLVRSALQGQAASLGTSLLFSMQDLAHDLYLQLLQKQRFRHYLESGMTDADIEREIFQVELTNHLIGLLRRYRPENYRMVRRIGNVLESDSRFKPVHTNTGVARYRQSAETVYGLAEWEPAHRAHAGHSIASALAQVSMRRRDLRRAGCSGDTQVIVSNQELAALLVEILQALDAPASLRMLRQLALSKLPVWDVTLTPIDTEAENERVDGIAVEKLASAEADPEARCVQREEAHQAQNAARALLARLHASTRENVVRTERLCRVLWHCYFDPAEPSQMAIAELVGVSDSSVGDYRRKIENEIRRMSLSITQVTHFSDALREELWRRLFSEDVEQKPGYAPQLTREVEMLSANFSRLLPLLARPAIPCRLEYSVAG